MYRSSETVGRSAVPSSTAVTHPSRLLASLALLIGIAALVLGGPVTPAQAAIVDVTSCADSGPGSLREAVANASDGDTILFARDCTGPDQIALTHEIHISGRLTITGGTYAVTIDGGGGTRLFDTEGNVTLSHLALAHGTIGDGGGAIYNAGTLTVQNSTLSGNSAETGGGIFNFGTVTVQNSTLSGNSAADSGSGGITNSGGGIANSGGGTVTVQNSTLSDNSASEKGGGIYSGSGTVTLQNSTFSGNSSSVGGGVFNGGTVTLQNDTLTGNDGGDRGGGIYNVGTAAVLNSTLAENHARSGGGIRNDGVLTMQNSTLTANRASIGAGIANGGGTVTVQNSTLSGNSASGDGGGGIYNHGTVTVQNSTLSDNTADNDEGGGILNLGVLTVQNSTLSGNRAYVAGGIFNNGGSAAVANSILANSLPNCFALGDRVTDGGYNLQFGDASCGFSDHAVSGDPLLGGLVSNGGPTRTMALGEGSAAIGAGNPTSCQAAGIDDLDQRGLSRNSVARGRCDIGAYDTRGSVAGPVSAATTTITRNPSKIVADGLSASTITVRARDLVGYRFQYGGSTVTLQTTLGSLSPVTDNHNGAYTATLTSGTVRGTAKVTGTINGTPLTATTGVDFAAGPASAAMTTISRSPDKIVADGLSTSTITVRAMDQYGNALQVGGASVTMATDLGSISSVTDAGAGRYTATLTSLVAGTATVSGTINTQTIAATTTVVVTPRPPLSVGNCNDAGPGSLRAVIAAAGSGQRIVFAQDCTGLSRITLASVIDIGATILTIDGAGHSVVIDGGSSSPLFHVLDSTTVTISHLILAHGTASDFGGAVSNDGTLTVQNSTLIDNHSGNAGGAIYNHGTLTVENSTLSSGGAGLRGGGIYSEGTATVRNSTLAGNHAFFGGGIYSTGPLTMENSTLSGNSANYGGGIENVTTMAVRDSTLSANSASTEGGGVYNFGSLTVSNSVLANAATGNCGGHLPTDGGYNADFGASCGFADHVVSGNPLLGSLASNGGPTQTQALSEGSPAIAAGSPTLCQATGGDLEQRGLSRRSAARSACDIGAYDTRGSVAGALSVARTTITRSASRLVADGLAAATITVRARDANGIAFALGGAAVTLQTTLGSLSSVTDNHNGTYTATLKSTVAGTGTVSGTIDGSSIPANVGVDFVAGPPAGAATTMSRSATAIPANGTSTATVTVIAKDQYGNELKVGGATILLNTTRGSLGPVTDLGNGRYRATLTSSVTPGTAVISGTVNGQAIGHGTSMSFT